jgi:hypothetical protein
MKRPQLHPTWAIVVVMAFAPVAESAEPVTLENVKDPGPNKLDEPVAEKFSLDRAVDFLDSASLTRQKQRQCFTCHTNYAYLLARPAISGDSADGQRIQRGITWLKMHQRESGSWVTCSLNNDGRHFISDAGTAFALKALAEGGEVKRGSTP